MKLHLPVKLRASLIAAVIAVSASVYNAVAMDIVSPSDETGWRDKTVKIDLRYTGLDANTYTTMSGEILPYACYTGTNVRVGYVLDDGGNPVQLDYDVDSKRYSYTLADGTVVDNVTPKGYYAQGTAAGDPMVAVDETGNAIVAGETAPATISPTPKIVVEAAPHGGDALVTYHKGNFSFTTDGQVIFNNTLKSNTENGGYLGKVSIDTNEIIVNKDANGAGSLVVLEDATITDHADGTALKTAIADKSRLAILNGNTNNLSAEELQHVAPGMVSSGITYGDRTVQLGAVSGPGSLSIVGSKTRTAGTAAYVTAPDAATPVAIASIAGTAEVGIANADAAVTGNVGTKDIYLVNSKTTVGGSVATKGLDVNAESVLAAQGQIETVADAANRTNVAGKLSSAKSYISLINGAVTEGATLSAANATNGNISLSKITATAAKEITAGRDLTLTASSIADSNVISVGHDLTLQAGDGVASSITDSHVQSVGNNVTVKGASSISGTTIDSVGGNVDVKETSTVTDSTINGIVGNIDITDSTVTDSKMASTGDGTITITRSTVKGTAALDTTAPASSLSTGHGKITIKDHSTVENTAIANTDDTGAIEISDTSTVTGSTVSTHDGNIDITSSTVADSSVTSAGNGNITITNSAVQGTDELDETAPVSLVSTGSGDISITTGSRIANTAIRSVGTGAIGISGASTVTGSTVTTGEGAVNISGSTVAASTVASAGNGAITVTDATITDSTVKNAGKGDITIGSTPVLHETELSGAKNDNADAKSFSCRIADLQTGLDQRSRVAVSSISVVERESGNPQSLSDVRLRVKDSSGTVIATSTNAVSFGNAEAVQKFSFDGLTLDPNAKYTYEFVVVNGTGDATAQTVSVRLTKNSDKVFVGNFNNLPYSAVIAAEIATTPVRTSIVGSSVTTEDGAMTISGSDIANSTITAQNTSSIDDSTVADSAITVSSGDLTVTASAITGKSNLVVGGTATITDGSELSLNGGEEGNASITADKLVLQDIMNDTASVTNGTVAVTTETLLNGGNTLNLDKVNTGETAGTLGDLHQTSAGAQVNISGASHIDIKGISTKDATDTADATSYFTSVTVTEASTVKVTEDALITGLAVTDENSSVTFEKNAWLTSAYIDTAETTVKGEGHIGNLTLANDATLDLVGEGKNSCISHLAGTAGTINVSNGTLTTPELDSADLTLGLNGGTVVLGGVTAAQGATVASGAVNGAVHVKEITNAGTVGATATSTIKTTLNRVNSLPSSDMGDAVTQGVNVRPFLVTSPVTINGTVYAAGSLIALPDFVATDTTVPQLGNVTSGVELVLTNELLGKLLLLEQLKPVVDENGNQVVDEDGKLVWESTTDGVSTQVTTLMDVYPGAGDITYYPGAQGTNGSVVATNDGIASLTVDGGFGADKAVINAYETGSVVAGVAVADAGTGFIAIGGDVTGQGNTLTADNDITITGGITPATVGTAETHNTLVSNRGNITVASITDSYLSATATKGRVVVTGGVTGSDNTLAAGTSVSTGAITGDTNTLTAGTSVTTGAITGNGNTAVAATSIEVTGAIGSPLSTSSNNTLTAGTSISTVDIVGNANKLTAGTSIGTGAISGNANKLVAATADDGTIQTGAITGSSNVLAGSEDGATASGDLIKVDGAIRGSNNIVNAGTSVEVTGSMGATGATSNHNTLTAGTAVTTADITGSGNTLTAGTAVTTADITGSGNTLTAGTAVTTADITGNGNTLTGAIGVDTGTVTGDGNELTATTGTVEMGGLNGEGNTIAAADGDVHIAAITGLATDGSGLVNGISATGTVAIDTLGTPAAGDDPATATTATTAINADSVVLGAGSAANMTIAAADHVAVTDVALADSVITTDSITGGSLTMSHTDGDAISSVNSVAVGSLTLAGLQHVDVTGSVTTTDLKLLDQAHLDTFSVVTDTLHMDSETWLLADSVTVNKELSLDEGAALVSHTVTLGQDVTEVTVEDGSTLEVFGDLVKDDATLTVTDGDVNLNGSLTMGEISVGEDGSISADSITTTGAGATSGDIIIHGGSVESGEGVVTAAGNIVVDNDGVLSSEGDIVATGAITVGSAATDTDAATEGSIATKGNLNGASLTAHGGMVDVDGDMVLGGALAATDTDINAGNITMNGELQIVGTASSEIGDVGGARNATLENVQMRDLTGFSGSLTATDSVIHEIETADGATIDGLALTNTVVENGNTDTLAVTGAVSLEGSTLASGLTATGTADVTVTNRSVVSGDLTAADAEVLLLDSEVGGKLTAATATVEDGMAGGIDLAGKLTAAGNVVSTSDISASGLEMTDGHLGAVGSDITLTGDATLTSASVDADTIALGGSLTATDSRIGADVAGAAAVALTSSVIDGDVTMATDGALGLDGTHAVITGDVTNAASTTVGTVATVGTLDTGDLDVQGGKVLTAAGDVTANGLVAVDGSLTSGGSVALAGAEGSAITGSVQAAEKVTLGGTLDVTGPGVTGDAGVDVTGTVTATDTQLRGEVLDVTGTLNVESGAHLAVGQVKGTGTLNLHRPTEPVTLASNTDMQGGAVNLQATTLDAAADSHVGTLTVDGDSTLIIAGEGNIGEVNADSVVLKRGATIKADVNLNARMFTNNDVLNVASTVDMGGNSLTLTNLGGTASEETVADGTTVEVINGDVLNVNEDVNHNFSTLNAHMLQDGTVVLSRNYKTVAETDNQKKTSEALQLVRDLGVVRGDIPANSQLAKVFEALDHTRSAADAREALDTLGGAGLSGVSKTVTDEAFEHLVTLRSALQSVAADVQFSGDPRCCNYSTYSKDRSFAISGTVTGGNTEVTGDNNDEYTRSSVGFMLGMAKAISKNWAIGADVAASFADATCGKTDIDSSVFFIDLAVMNRNGRFSQTATVGVGMFDIDTERSVSFNANGMRGYYSGTAKGSTSATVVNLSYEAVYDLVDDGDGNKLGAVGLVEGTFGQIDGMTETGMGNAGLNSQYDNVANATVGLGLRYTHGFIMESAPGFFTVGAMVVGNMGETAPKVTNNFAGGTTFELEGPDSGNVGLRVNAGVLIPLDDQVGIFGNVNSEFRADQTHVGGNVGIKITF